MASKRCSVEGCNAWAVKTDSLGRCQGHINKDKASSQPIIPANPPKRERVDGLKDNPAVVVLGAKRIHDHGDFTLVLDRSLIWLYQNTEDSRLEQAIQASGFSYSPKRSYKENCQCWLISLEKVQKWVNQQDTQNEDSLLNTVYRRVRKAQESLQEQTEDTPPRSTPRGKVVANSFQEVQELKAEFEEIKKLLAQLVQK